MEPSAFSFASNKEQSFTSKVDDIIMDTTTLGNAKRDAEVDPDSDLKRNTKLPRLDASGIGAGVTPAPQQLQQQLPQQQLHQQQLHQQQLPQQQQQQQLPQQQMPTDKEDTLQTYPFFYYRDFSAEGDPDSLTPLTPPGRVPNFPAKMHSILSRPELADIVCWMPHGRSWRVLKPREFEVRVIPTYFEHSKFSSFIRQANGWGFRRMTQGRDRNSYYQELFLRGLPHLCKKMKRPGVSEKETADPEHEPDFYRISEQYPVPEKAEDESILLHCTVRGGPKARMPICAGNTMLGLLSPSASTSMDIHQFSQLDLLKSPPPQSQIAASATPINQLSAMPQMPLNGFDQHVLSELQNPLGAPEKGLGSTGKSDHLLASAQVENTSLAHHSTVLAGTQVPSNFEQKLGTTAAAAAMGGLSTAAVDNSNNSNKDAAALASANQLAFSNPNFAAAFTASSSAASQFAAGFAAAAALQHQQFQTMLGSLAGSAPTSGLMPSLQQLPPPQQVQLVQQHQEQQVPVPPSEEPEPPDHF